MARRKSYRPLMVLVVLAAVAFVAATVAFTNVTYWLINATRPPAMKYPGADTAVAGGQYVKVSYYYDSGRGINITRISIIGFTGDPVNYTSVIRVCNYYGTAPIRVWLVWRGPVTTTGYEQYIKAFLVGPATGATGTNIVGVGFVGSTTYTTEGPYTIDQGQCVTFGAHVAIDPAIPPNLANGRTVLGQYQVDIVMNVS
jgi:hypothetical protein